MALTSLVFLGVLSNVAFHKLGSENRSDLYASNPSSSCPALNPGLAGGTARSSARTVTAQDLGSGWASIPEAAVPMLGGRGFSDRGTTAAQAAQALRQVDGMWSVGQVISTIPRASDATAAYTHSVETLKCQPAITMLTSGIVDGAAWTLARFAEPVGIGGGANATWWVVARSGELVSSLVLTAAQLAPEPPSGAEARFDRVTVPDEAWVRDLAELAARRLASDRSTTPLPPLG